MIHIMKPDFEFSDERGFLCQLVHDGWKQVNVVTSKAGVRRGGHYHRLNREAFYVVEGSFSLSVTDGNQTETYTFRKGNMFLIEPGIRHDFIYLEDTVLVGLYDCGVESPDGTKDIYVD